MPKQKKVAPVLDNPEPATAEQEDRKPGTSELLFPEHYQEQNQPEVQEPEKQEEPAPEPEPTPEPEPEQKEEETEQPEADPNAPVYLEDILTKMGIDPTKVRVRTKVDKEESEIGFLDLKKGYQTDQALTRRGQKIGEERKRLEELRSQLLAQETGRPGPAVTREEQAQSEDPVVQSLQNEIAELRSMTQTLAPVIYESNRKRVADELKEQGFDDFLEFVPKIDSFVANVEDPQLWRYYNTPEGAKAAYYQLKAQELRQGQQAPPQQPPVQQKPAQQRPKPPVVKIPQSGGTGTGAVDDWGVKYNDAMRRWKETGDQDALSEVMRLKGLTGKA